MRVTRSVTRSLSSIASAAQTATSNTSTAVKRKQEDASKPAKRPRAQAQVSNEAPMKEMITLGSVPARENGVPEDVSVPAVLSFRFEDARQHLVNADVRFEDLFSKLKCKPYEHLETVHPFQALVKSILGQQISWMAARSINHKFIRLYNLNMPEKPSSLSSDDVYPFPTPAQVAGTDIPTLRSAGLSARKAEYVKDLASRFADGRLSTQKLLNADDDELARMLIEVRGIGRWTVDMFAIFSLRRPDILPVGDLGVQRGILRWFLSLHSPSHTISIDPEKVSGGARSASGNAISEPTACLVSGVCVSTAIETQTPEPSQATQTTEKADEIDTVHPPINRMLNSGLSTPSSITPLPEGMSVADLQNRLAGKNKIKGALLTPQEMEALTEPWRPYRSLGVYYMWSLAEGSNM